MTNIRSSEATLRKLEKATRTRPTPQELRQQRVSFIMGSLDRDSNITRERVEKVLAEEEGR